MFQRQLLILLGGCLLTASAAGADDVGYVDCSNYPASTKVLGKAGRTSEVVTSLPCGERFTILIYGVFFSRIQTKDGKVGYVYSYLISRDSSATSAPQPSPAQAPAPGSNVPPPSAAPVQSKPSAPAPSAPASNSPASAVMVVQPRPSTPAQSAPASSVLAPTPVVVQPKPSPPAPSASASNAPAPSATVVQPRPTTPIQIQPAPPQPEARVPVGRAPGPPLERPIPRFRTGPLVELFGGYGFARFGSGGNGTNLNGGLASFGWNIKPWLQIVGDNSYNLVTVSGTKNVLYGNHFGPRLFHRGRWRATPFVEALFGGSRVDTTVAGVKFSDNGFSIKAGGGLDVSVSSHFAMRLFDVDYYRAPFLTTQNNYWASAGIVFRLGGGRPQ